MQRVRPAGSKAKDVVPEELPVDNPKPMGKPVDVRAEKPRSGATPGDDEAYEPMPRNGPIADPRIAIGPVKPIMYELTPRDEGGDNQSNMKRPADGEKSVPTTDGRPNSGEAETEAGRPKQRLSHCCTKHLHRPKYRIGRTEKRCP